MQYQRAGKLIDIKKLRRKTVSIVGLGSLGSFTALMLAKNGINLNLIDFDEVSEENLNSQIYSINDLGNLKTNAMKDYLKEINPEINVKIQSKKLDSSNLDILDSDLVIDCTDNLDARFLIDSYCHSRIPWIHTAAIRTLGLVYVVEDSLSDLYNSDILGESCNEHGIFNTTALMTASIASTQAVKILLGQPYEKDLIRFNIWSNAFDKIKVNPGKKKIVRIIKLCRNNYSINLKKRVNLNIIAKKHKVIFKNSNIVIIKPRIIINKNGYILFENSSRESVKKWLRYL